MRRANITIGLMVLALAMVPACSGRAASDSVMQSPDRLMATQLLMMAQAALISGGELRPDQTTRARILTDLALELVQDEPQLLMVRAQLAHMEEEQDIAIEALRKYLKQRPLYESTQLSYIRGLVARLQTADAQLETLEHFLQAGAARQLSAPLRSRLAVLAASTSWEMGDKDRFAKWLKVAVELDPANAQAAQLTLEFAVESGGDPRQLGAAGVALVRSAPLNGAARINLATLLLTQGVYGRSAEQFEAAMRLINQPLQYGQVHALSAAFAGASRSDDALELLAAFEGYVRREARAAVAQAREEGETTDVDPETVTLGAQLELMRLVIYADGDDQESADATFAKVRDALLVAEATEDANPRFQYYWLGALLGKDLERIESEISQEPAADPVIRRTLGLLALQRGDEALGREILEPLAGDEDEVATYALAVLLKRAAAAEARLLQSIVYKWPLSAVGLMAARRLAAQGYDVKPTPIGASLVRLMDKFPDDLWQIDPAGMEWIDMELTVDDGRFDYLEPVPAKITIRNRSTMALGVGADQTVPNSVRLQLAPSASGRPVGNLPPINLPIDRVLTIEPGQTVETEVRLDHTILGVILSGVATDTVYLNATAIFDPIPTETGFELGPLGSTDTVRAVAIYGEPFNPHNFDRWLDQAASDDVLVQMKAMARLFLVAGEAPDDRSGRDVVREIARVLNEQFASLTKLRQAWCVRFLHTDPDELPSESPFQRIIELSERSDDTLVQVTYLASQVREDDHPALIAAMRGEDVTVRRFAAALKAALKVEAEAKDKLEAEQARAAAEAEAAEAAAEAEKQKDGDGFE